MSTALFRLGGVLALALGLAFTLLAGSASAQMSLKPDGPFQAPYSSLDGQTAQGGPYGPTAHGGPYAPVGAAQIPSSVPASRLEPVDAGSTAAGRVGVSPNVPAPPCGFYSRWEAYYKHCKSNRIVIRVRFNYWGGTRDISVWPGTTNLSTRPSLQNNGMITNAWCVTYC